LIDQKNIFCDPSGGHQVVLGAEHTTWRAPDLLPGHRMTEAQFLAMSVELARAIDDMERMLARLHSSCASSEMAIDGRFLVDLGLDDDLAATQDYFSMRAWGIIPTHTAASWRSFRQGYRAIRSL
jgi:hypothetical protein